MTFVVTAVYRNGETAQGRFASKDRAKHAYDEWQAGGQTMYVCMVDLETHIWSDTHYSGRQTFADTSTPERGSTTLTVTDYPDVRGAVGWWQNPNATDPAAKEALDTLVAGITDQNRHDESV